jgi:tRNA dimethylallyltransferase
MSSLDADSNPKASDPLPVVLLMGPTAAGKTDLALELIEEFPFEIVSVDSAMIYRGLDIGTGKPSQSVLRRVPHHLVDILDPSERYSAGQFVRDAERLIGEIRGRNKVPLLVGGTMLYFKALTQGLADLPEADRTVRAELDSRAAAVGWPALHEELTKVDPVAARKILPNDAQRIQRALEVFRLTGRRLSELQAVNVRHPPKHEFIQLVWSPLDRAVLYERIAARFTRMMDAGFLEEVRRLAVRKDLSRDLPALRAVGYRQLLGYFAEEYSLEEAVRRGIVATRHLARRQLIWLRAGVEFEWFDSLELAATARIKGRISACLQAG